MSAVVKIDNLSKVYRLGKIGSQTFSSDLKRTWARIFRREDPVIKYAEKNIRKEKGDSEYICALKDINLEINEGDVLGIVGKNGAGKSTLLKILSRITSPTTGSAKIRGRIASLLEVGTGFHPELTGRENIYLNGAILGMKKSEIEAKFDKIVDFSGIERYIETPVKRYSSGMHLRLAFAVAAHLEPEILLIDEVLAVGDYSFQQKCLGKMKDVSKQGRTVLFVSHNLGSIRALCDMVVLLEDGMIKYHDTAQNTIEYYRNSFIRDIGIKSFKIEDNLDAYVKDIKVTDLKGNILTIIPLHEPYRVVVQVNLNQEIKKCILGIGFSTLENIALRTIWSKPADLERGEYEFTFTEENIFYTGKYQLHLGLSMIDGKIPIQFIKHAITLEFEEFVDSQIAIDSKSGLIINQGEIQIHKL